MDRLSPVVLARCSTLLRELSRIEALVMPALDSVGCSSGWAHVLPSARSHCKSSRQFANTAAKPHPRASVIDGSVEPVPTFGPKSLYQTSSRKPPGCFIL